MFLIDFTENMNNEENDRDDIQKTCQTKIWKKIGLAKYKIKTILQYFPPSLRKWLTKCMFSLCLLYSYFT